ncbi:MAG: SH3 domain-containing protein [Bacteroidetes bacterium]|nr:SH3 domain-containing protein [Bacteroidota bacterium]MCL5026269.1 SH3 domain-containing protein [Chloroflexota bacterium]
MQFSRTALMLGLAALGLALGLVLGTRISGPRNASIESYLAMAATLYAEGESIDSVRDRLAWLKGYDLPGTLRSMSDKYDRDPQKRDQAVALRRLAEALATTPKTTGTPKAKPGAPAASPTAMASIPTPPAASTTPTPAPGGRLPPLAANQLPRPGVIRPEGGGSTNLRIKPATVNSPVIRILPAEAKVRILRVVEGEAVSPGEPWWYEIEFEGSTGFVYYRLVEW